MREVVVVASEEARGVGIRGGMALAEARAMWPGVEVGRYEPEKDRKGLEALGRWMMRFSPVVGVGERHEGTEARRHEGREERKGESEKGRRGEGRGHGQLAARGTRRCGEHGRDAHATLLLDVTGCERVFGGMGNLVEQVREAMRGMGIGARVAVGPTVGAAWAVAAAGGDGRIVGEGEVRKAIEGLPVGALRIDWETVEALHQLGIETIGQVMGLPREALPARFGPTLLLRVDQALGRVEEPLVPLEYCAPVEAKMEFEGVVNAWEAIEMALKRCIEQVVEELKRRGAGAREVEMELMRAEGPAIRKNIRLSRASREERKLFRLVRCAVEMGRDEGGRSAKRQGAWGANGQETEVRRQKSGFRSRETASGKASGLPFADALTLTLSQGERGKEGLGGRGVGGPECRLESLHHSGGSAGASPFPTAAEAAPTRLHQNGRAGGADIANGGGRGVCRPYSGGVLKQTLQNMESHVPAGFVGVGLKVVVWERVSDEQMGIVEQEEQAGRRELEDLVERLVLRLGEEGIGQARLVESYVPEKAFGFFNGTTEQRRIGIQARRHEGTKARSEGQEEREEWVGSGSSRLTANCLLPNNVALNIEHPTSNIQRRTEAAWGRGRPLRVWGPVEIGVMVSPSEDREGRPISFTGASPAYGAVQRERSGSSLRSEPGVVHRVVQAVGPERIGGQWWEGHNKTRDYFEVEDEEGRRHWIFRVRETGKWYWQGIFG